MVQLILDLDESIDRKVKSYKNRYDLGSKKDAILQMLKRFKG